MINFFIDGLKPKLKSELNLAKPISLRRAFALAKVHEAHRIPTRIGGNAATGINSELILKNPPAGTKTLPIVRKMLTVEERKERRAKGLCFNCDEIYTPGHKYRGRLFHLGVDSDCLVEIVEQNDEADTSSNTNNPATTTEISLHAFSGTFNPRTIRLTGWVQGRPLSVLIDSGSTHNLIQESVVNRLGFEVHFLPEFRVFIGSGKFLVCKEVCRQVAMTIQNTAIVEDLFVLSMGGANIELGIQ